MNKIYEVDYGGNIIRYAFLDQKTRRYFKRYIHPSDSEEFDVCSNEGRIESARTKLPEDADEAYVEYRTLIGLTAKALLKYRSCIFHSVSFVYHDYAWLLCAPSGTGKTTQYFNWQRLFPDEIKMISGDMPVLKMENESSISVHPSSWNGKEDIGSQISAPLGGIIFLAQGEHNEIFPLSVKEGLMDIYGQFVVLPDTEDEIHSLTELIACIFQNYPVMKFINLGNEDSTILLKNTIDRILENKHEIQSQRRNCTQ